MGVFIVGSTVILVLLQATLLLLDRKETSWTFSLIEKSNNDSKFLEEETIQKCLQSHESSKNITYHNLNSESHMNTYCYFWYPRSSNQILIKPILTQWNPHLILLAITCIHCIIALYATKKKKDSNHSNKNKHFNYICISGTLFLLWIIVAFIVGFVHQHHSKSLLEPSTWISCLFLFASTGIFLYIQNKHDPTMNTSSLQLWSLVFQLQVVGVPLTVLILATMGIRTYSEIIIHFLILSAAVNSLWLQVTLQGSALYMAKLLTVALPLISIYLTHVQLPNIQHIITGMATASLIPLFVMPVILNNDDPILRAGEKLDRFQLRLGSMCSTAALLATIVNLAKL